MTRPGHSPYSSLAKGNASLKRIARLAKRTHLGILHHQPEDFQHACRDEGAPDFIKEPNNCFVLGW
jgi:hypothetical protein